MRRFVSLALATLLAAGCAGGAARPLAGEPAPPPPPAVSPGPAAPPDPPAPAPPAAPPGPAAVELLPREDLRYSYFLSDGPLAEEQYVREGERLIGAYNGKTYVTWFITDSGIWRPDPRGPGLLRYLPPVLQDNLAWKQASGADEVWFLLRRQGQCSYGKDPEPCWELTLLNRLERVVFRFQPDRWVAEVWSENLANPGDAYRKEQIQQQPGAVAAPVREQMLREGPRRPDGALPPVAEVTPAQFDGALKAMLNQAGRPFAEIDLNADGAPERIEGRLGDWTDGPLHLFAGDSHLPQLAFREQGPYRLEILNLPGFDRPTLLYEHGQAGTWHGISTLWLHEHLYAAGGWHPKISEAFGAQVRVEPDGLVVVRNNPADMAGYTWTRRYRLEKEESPSRYRARLEGESVAPGPYPDTPAELLTAAFVARWYGLDADLERYIPDPGPRQALQQHEKATRPAYIPRPVQVGRLVMKQADGWPAPVPEIEPAPAGPDGGTDFLVRVGQYEGYVYLTGRVTFGRDGAGRLVISKLEITGDGFVY